MKKTRYLLVILIVCLPMITLSAFAQESNLLQLNKHSGEDIMTYKNSNDGVDAFLVFHEFDNGTESQEGFALMCQVSAILKDAETGTLINRARLALRDETSNNKLSIPQALVRVAEESMQTKLFVSDKGTRHYVLVAQIEGLGLREFKFQHTFN